MGIFQKNRPTRNYFSVQVLTSPFFQGALSLQERGAPRLRISDSWWHSSDGLTRQSINLKAFYLYFLRHTKLHSVVRKGLDRAGAAPVRTLLGRLSS